MTFPTGSPLALHEQDLRNVIVGWRATVDGIRKGVSDDQRIASTAKGEVTGERVNAIRGQWLDALAAIIDSADALVGQLTGDSVDLLPDRDGSLEAILERQASWARWQYLLSKQPELRPQAIFAQATSVEDVFCLNDELPMYFRANGYNADIVEQVGSAAAVRLAEIAGPDAVAALAQADAAEVARTRMQPIVEQATAEIAGMAPSANTLHAALSGWTAAGAQSRRFMGLPPS